MFCAGEEVQLQPFLTSALEEDGGNTFHRERVLGTQWIGYESMDDRNMTYLLTAIG
jgi:hypothetical protein